MVQLPAIYPGATKLLDPDANLMKPFVDVRGVTIHYTASRSLDATYKTLMDRGLNYHFLIERDGSIIQTAKMTHSVYHAGKANWLGDSPNRTHISISLLSWGKLDAAHKTWVGRRLPDDEIAFRQGHWWDRCLLLQEEALLVLGQWLVCQGIPASRFCGHDECALPRGRKVDPGGVISFTMDEFRRLLISVQA